MAKLSAKDRFIEFILELNAIFSVKEVIVNTWVSVDSDGPFQVWFKTSGVDLLELLTESKPARNVLLNIKEIRSVMASNLTVRQQINLLEVIDRTDTFTLKHVDLKGYCLDKLGEHGIKLRFNVGE